MSNLFTALSANRVFTLTEDYRNAARKRNSVNTDIFDYNCGGYALETYSWLIPFYTESSADPWTWKEIRYPDIDECDYSLISLEEEMKQDEEFIAHKNEVKMFLEKAYDRCNKNDIAKWETGNIAINILTTPKVDYLRTLSRLIFSSCLYAHPFALELAAYTMLQCFPDMRRVDSWTELRDDEYGIAYTGGDGDFHFAKFIDGVISHKMGGSDIKEVESVEDAFLPRYNGRIVYFAKKKKLEEE